jgi:hypothetical protein
MNGLSTPRHHAEAPEDATAGSVRASRFLTAEDADRLVRFYLGFDFEARHDRFGAEASDDAIIEYCDAIEWRRSFLIARADPFCLEAVLEIHPLSQQWDCAELIAACPSRGDRSHSFAQLLQLAAFAAGQRGCRTFLVPSNDMLREILPLLQGIGRVRIATMHASVDLSDYAFARQRARTATMWPMQAAADVQMSAQLG